MVTKSHYLQRFLATDPKIFLKAPKYTNIEGGARAKKTQFFFFKIFQKVPKTVFFSLFILNYACGAEILASFSALAELEKLIWPT